LQIRKLKAYAQPEIGKYDRVCFIALQIVSSSGRGRRHTTYTKPYKETKAVLFWGGRGAKKICPNIFYLPEYDQFSWQNSQWSTS